MIKRRPPCPLCGEGEGHFHDCLIWSLMITREISQEEATKLYIQHVASKKNGERL
jgi:hypothetical protein